MSFGRGERVEKTSNFPTAALLVLGVLASGLVLGLNLDSRVIDVGYAGVVGADRILDGVLPYGTMPEEVGTGDTYGPLNYLLYVPFLWFFGWSGEWDFLPAAHAVTALAFIVGAISMLIAGRRYAGAQGGADPRTGGQSMGEVVQSSASARRPSCPPTGSPTRTPVATSALVPV